MDVLEDVRNSIAYLTIDKNLGDNKISTDVAKRLKDDFASLHKHVLQAYEIEKEFLKKGKQLHQELLSEKLNCEKLEMRKQNDEKEVEDLMKARNLVAEEVREAEKQETAVQFTLTELQRERQMLIEERESLKQDNLLMVTPELEMYKQESEQFQKECADRTKAKENQEKLRQDLSLKLEELLDQQEELGHVCRDRDQELISACAVAPRLRKQTAVVERAVEDTLKEKRKLMDQLEQLNDALKQQEKSKIREEEEIVDLTRRLEQQHHTIQIQHRDVEAVERNLKMEKSQHQSLVEKRCKLELDLNQLRTKSKRAADNFSSAQKRSNKLKRILRRQIHCLDEEKASISPLKMDLIDCDHQLHSYMHETKQLQKRLSQVKHEVDMFVASFLKQEGLESKKAEELKLMLEDEAELEGRRKQWTAEEEHMARLIVMLSAQREVKARESGKMEQSVKDAREQLKIKQLVLLDLSKKANEAQHHLKEFSSLYDVVKNERNKYVNLIQASAQALAEMREKVKILQNEIDILRSESLAKDKALAKERIDHQAAQQQRDQLRAEGNRAQGEYQIKKARVESQIVEIDKMNVIVNTMEKEMVALKTKYEQSVEGRNYTGIQLIDRNDELCILHEKENIQQQALRDGEIAFRAREEDLRVASLELAEFQRQLQVTRSQLPKLPKHAKRILELRQELERVKKDVMVLSQELETPMNPKRWRKLIGEIPDMDQVKAKVQVLEQRLHQEKEKNVEKELVLEEVSALSERLRGDAVSGRESMIELAKKVNKFQAKIRDVTRKMMAVVSELSMYQATAIRLDQEKHIREQELEEAAENIHNNKAPTVQVENEWYRRQREKLRKREAQLLQADGQAPAFGDTMGAASLRRTTAEARPNAYLSEDTGLPQPYTNAPFKPTVGGSTMRHIRKPVERELEV